jgi:hypothetical protein
MISCSLFLDKSVGVNDGRQIILKNLKEKINFQAELGKRLEFDIELLLSIKNQAINSI